jgi:outer membrane protein
MRPGSTVLLMLLCAVPARADLKLGYVDLQRSLTEVAEGREARARLKVDADQQKAAVEREQARLREDKLVLDRQSAMMSEEVRTQRLTEWQRRLFELSQRAEQRQQELAGKERSELKKIFDRMDPIIAAIAQREGLALVLEKTDSGLLYALPTLDLTPELVRTYNDRHPGKVRAGVAPLSRDGGP